jgi:hypothetical protein
MTADIFERNIGLQSEDQPSCRTLFVLGVAFVVSADMEL